VRTGVGGITFFSLSLNLKLHKYPAYSNAFLKRPQYQGFLPTIITQKNCFSGRTDLQDIWLGLLAVMHPEALSSHVAKLEKLVH